MIGINMYNNPFINRDANTDSVDEIINYWCEPAHIQLKEMLFSNKAIIIEGPRGCGKTTLFKYFSYKGQELLGHNLSSFLREGKYICMYHRIGEYNYSALNGKGLDNVFWQNLFVHTFELKLSLMLMNTIKEFFDNNDLNIDEKELVLKLSQISGFSNLTSFDELIDKIQEFIGHVNDFTRKRSMMEINFEPVHWYSYYEIVETIVMVFNSLIEHGSKFKIAFVIDELENLSLNHQKIINTYVKFVKENITFRIGTRPAGILTFDTLTNESIRENHDYSYIEINPYLKLDEYEKFLMEIANKRLSTSNYCQDNIVTIENLLGRKENIQDEINRKIPSGFNEHFRLIKRAMSEEQLRLIKSDDKLQELLNIIKLNRNEDINSIHAQMNAFNSKKDKKSMEYKKYENAYQNKYKKSLAFLMLNIAEKNKSYYSLKTFAHLSSGSTRIFLQLCHKLFELASFRCPNVLRDNKMIDPELQTEAALKVAESEMNYLKRVGPHGKEIFNFIDNVCRLFRYYHNDVQLKYPETNQFTLDDTLTDEEYKIINVARMHAFIIRKSKLQQRSIGQPKTHIYTINRMYFPLYNISCVTRGGFNPKITSKIMKEIVVDQLKNTNAILRVFRGQIEKEIKQINIEDLIYE